MELLKYRKQQTGGRATLGGQKLERLGDFRIVREIGRGGMGIVFEAEQESLARHVAIKVLPRHALLAPESLKRFHRGARIAAGLHHTNIVSVFGVGQHEGLHYYVMQYIRGVGLDRVIDRLAHGEPLAPPIAETGSQPADETRVRPSPELERILDSFFRPTATGHSLATGAVRPAANSPPPPPPSSEPLEAVGGGVGQLAPLLAGPLRCGVGRWETVARIGVQAARALHYAHTQGTLNCDIKPANLLLDAHGIVWITDFGVAKAMLAETLTQTGDLAGTLLYIAPERFQGQTDPRSDVYSLGLTLYELLALRPAFAAEHRQALIRQILDGSPPSPRKFDPHVPRDLETIVLKATARDPNHRYASAEALAEDLERFLDDRPVLARRTTPVERAVRWCRRNPVLAGLIATVAALSIAVTSFATVGYVQSRRANLLVRQVLELETRQRQESEATSKLALGVLDRIYAASGPKRDAVPATLTVTGTLGEPIEVPVTPAVSKEAATVLENLLLFYDRVGMPQGSDDQALRQAAQANRRAAEIHTQLGQLDKARAAYGRALEMYRQLWSRQPQSAALATGRAAIYVDLANLRIGQAVPEEAMADYNSARELLEPLATETAAPETRYQLARAYYYLGTLRPRLLEPSTSPRGQRPDGPRDRPPPGFEPPEFGPPPEGDSPLHGKPRGQRPDRLPPRPDDAEFGPAAGHHPHHPPDGPNGPGPDRVQCLARAIDLLTPLRREYPAVGSYRQLLGRCYRDLPPRRMAKFNFRDAIRQAMSIFEQLVSDFPGEPEYRLDLAEAYAVRALDGPPPAREAFAEAEPYFRKSLSIHELLAAKYPNVSGYATGLVNTLFRMAKVEQEVGRTAEAQTALEKARGLVVELMQRFPDDPSNRIRAVVIQNALADGYRAQHQWSDARRVLEDALRQLDALPAPQRELPHLRELRRETCRNLADIREDPGQAPQPKPSR
jgi:serine/threonine protein kinase